MRYLPLTSSHLCANFILAFLQLSAIFIRGISQPSVIFPKYFRPNGVYTKEPLVIGMENSVNGNISKELLESLFTEYNAAYFSGGLKRCKCSVLYGSRALGMYTHHRNAGGPINGRIWIARDVDWTEDTLRTVVVHEMVHHWVWQTYGRNSGLMGHGRRFMRKCRELNRAYGLNLKRVDTDIYHRNEKIPTTRLGRLLRCLKFRLSS